MSGKSGKVKRSGVNEHSSPSYDVITMATITPDEQCALMSVLESGREVALRAYYRVMSEGSKHDREQIEGAIWAKGGPQVWARRANELIDDAVADAFIHCFVKGEPITTAKSAPGVSKEQQRAMVSEQFRLAGITVATVVLAELLPDEKVN